MRRAAVVAAAVLLGGAASGGGLPEPKRPAACEPAMALRIGLAPDSVLRAYMDRIRVSWLLPAPGSNPAMLAMFADRDRPPYRNLLPWSGEFAGKYLTGATQVLATGRDEALERSLAGFVSALAQLQDADGYLGPFPKEHRLTGNAPNVGDKGGGTWDAWGHYHALLGLLLWHERQGDKAALDAARRIGDLLCDRFLGAEKRPRLVDTGSTEMNLAPAHGLALLYRATGEKRYLDLAKQIVDVEFAATAPDGAPLAGDYLRRGLAGEPFYRTPKPRWESLHPMMALSELAMITCEEKYAKAFENLWWSIVETDRHNHGGFSSGEQAQGNPYHQGAVETCCTVAWMAMTVEMLRLTGNPIAADELELSTYNAGLGQWHPSGRWSTYNTPMDGVRRANFDEIQFQCRPGSPELNCCSVNAARAPGLFSAWALMRDPDGVRLNAYEPCDLDTTLADGTALHLDVVGRYPVDPNVVIGVSPAKPGRFTLRLRIPHWSTRTEVTIDGEPVREEIPAGRYLAIDREWKPGQTVRVKLDFTPHVWVGERECAGKAAIYRGPILLAYDPRFQAEAADPAGPVLEVSRLARILPALPRAGAEPAVVVAQIPATDGHLVDLCDFASAGADGGAYRSWLRVEGAEPAPFSRERPWRTRAVRGE